MAKQISPIPKFQFFDENGTPLVDGKLGIYAAGTTTPIVTYTDSTGAVENVNPIILDSRGECSVWLDANTQYKFVLSDSDDVTIWTVDYVAGLYIYGDDITWTGDHIFNGAVTLTTVSGNVTFTGSTTIDNNLYVTGDFAVDGTVSFNGIMVVDGLITSTISLGTAGTIADVSGDIEVSSADEIVLKVGNLSYTYTLMADGTFRLPVAPSDTMDAANKGYVDYAIAVAAPTGLVPVAVGAVVSNGLVAGSIGVDSVTHNSDGQYNITLSNPTTSTGKTIVMTTIRVAGTMDRNFTAYPQVDSTTSIAVQTGGGTTYAVSDRDFNFVVYSLP